MDLVNVRREGDAVVLTYPESRKEDVRRAFGDVLMGLVREGKQKTIVVDMGETEWLSSLELGVLVFALRDSQETGTRFAIARVGKRIQDVFQVTKTDTVFDIFSTVEAALEGGPTDGLEGE